VLHGANDTNVPVVEAEQVVENLKPRGVPVKYVLFPDEGHGVRNGNCPILAQGSKEPRTFSEFVSGPFIWPFYFATGRVFRTRVSAAGWRSQISRMASR
jgi:hypothetical protein